MLNHTFIDFRIAASLMNCFFSPSISDAEDSYEIAQEMKKKVKSKTILEKYIKKNKKSYNILDSSATVKPFFYEPHYNEILLLTNTSNPPDLFLIISKVILSFYYVTNYNET